MGYLRSRGVLPRYLLTPDMNRDASLLTSVTLKARRVIFLMTADSKKICPDTQSIRRPMSPLQEKNTESVDLDGGMDDYTRGSGVSLPPWDS